ncbi:hypothetical protein AK812_SmicGene33866 [Symbiodinium microadriaticum]|uniref:Uncharacterized protein n=1 Tax=Symbiodinium microadriaticum TaxID=2951 RepID=A0A1Q9CQL6_SYMMI|nr:hypothetical protein AK812_SmicGene33866 [Symbiodinium microadriaticum]
MDAQGQHEMAQAIGPKKLHDFHGAPVKVTSSDKRLLQAAVGLDWATEAGEAHQAGGAACAALPKETPQGEENKLPGNLGICAVPHTYIAKTASVCWLGHRRGTENV